MSQPHSYTVNKTPRILTRFTEPAAEESFVSYVDRVAAKHDVLLGDMISRLGLVDGKRTRAPTGWGIVLSPIHLERCSSVLRLPPVKVSDMLVSRYDGLCLNLEGVRTAEPDTLRRAAQLNWGYFSGSHLCSHCIKSGVWKTAWKLPWSFACEDHGLLLRCDCPQCERRTAGGRKDGWMEPAFHGRVPRPGFCNNSLPKGFAGQGKAGSPCGFDLSLAPTIAVERESSVMRAQQTINELLRAESDHERTKARQVFSELRSLVSLVLYTAEPEDLHDLPAICFKHFGDHVQARANAAEDRACSSDGRNGARPRCYIGAPKDPVLMAAVVPTALRLARIEDPVELRDEIAPLVGRLRFRGGRRVNPWATKEYFHLSERLSLAVRMNLEQRSSFDRRAGKASSTAEASQAQLSFDVCHIPQMVPDAVFDRHFAMSCVGVQRSNARRFCSMAMVKLKSGATWEQARESLSLPQSFARFPNRMIGVLRSNAKYEHFAVGLQHWAAELSTQSNLQDFAARRQQLAGFRDFHDACWETIRAAAGVQEDGHDSWRRHCAAWLWCELTCGDWCLSPAFNRADESPIRPQTYADFCTRVLPAMKPHLLALGKQMLKQVPHSEMGPER